MAIYPSINLSPQNMAVDTSINQNFSFIVSGSPITDYQIKIWDIGIIPNTLVHTSAKVALSPNKNNGDTVTHVLTGGTIVVNKNYKWQVETWSSSTSSASRQVVFESCTTPTMSLTIAPTVTTQNLTVTGVYSQAQSVPLNTFTFELYNSTNELIDTSGQIYGFSATYQFVGLQSGQTYKVKLYGDNQVGMTYDTGLVSFNVSYSVPEVSIVPTTVLSDETSIVTISWGETVQILGTAIGTPSYVTGLGSDSIKALSLDTLESVGWTFTIPEQFTLTAIFKINVGFSGTIIQLLSGYYFGYEDGKFYIDVNGEKIYTLPYYPLNKKYLIALKYGSFTIQEYNV